MTNLIHFLVPFYRLPNESNIAFGKCIYLSLYLDFSGMN